MAKFMSKELIAIRDNLQCAHCQCRFQGSDSQAWKVKYEGRAVYCSDVCRHAALRNKFGKPIPNRGPCKTCGEMFFSRREKEYCSVDCYTGSEQFKEMKAKNLDAINTARAKQAAERALSPENQDGKSVTGSRRRGEDVPCLECGTVFYRQPKSGRKYCCTSCYRTYLAKRFDRWVANPEGMALPQCFDEFLDREELACVVDGCEWKGQWLTLHLNQAHGIRASEFKRAAGFNLSTGVVARPLAQTLAQRENIGAALPSVNGLELARAALAARGVTYKSRVSDFRD